MRNRLADALKCVKQVSCFCGFDGFVDEVVHTVIAGSTRSVIRVQTLTEYGRRIANGSGLSINIEIVTSIKARRKRADFCERAQAFRFGHYVYRQRRQVTRSTPCLPSWPRVAR